MKTIHKAITAVAAAATILSAAAANAAPKRTLILLQENSGASFLDDYLDGPAQDFVRGIVDFAAENYEATKFRTFIAPHYDKFVDLSDGQCTRANLLSQLVLETKNGSTTDLVVLGHGTTETLSLHGDEKLTGQAVRPFRLPNGLNIARLDPGTIRTMLTEARSREGSSFNFKLRLVYMCNCFGATLNDDWLAIGAKTSVGAPLMNWMPEPMISKFWDDFVKEDKRVVDAANASLALAREQYGSNILTRDEYRRNPQVIRRADGTVRVVRMSRLQETQQVVAGNANLIFRDEYQLAVGQSRTFTVKANDTHTFVKLHHVAGQRYSYSAVGTWKGGFFAPNDNANGHAAGADGRRVPGAASMRLCGERFRKHDDIFTFINGSAFSIGRSNTITAGGTGFVNLYANDNLLFYGDNSGEVSVTVTRLQ